MITPEASTWPPIAPIAGTRMTATATAAEAARTAQAAWREEPVAKRLVILRRLRALIARDGIQLAEAAGATQGRGPAEKLTAEVIPLAAAAEFLEQQAVRLLCPRHLGKAGRPVWLAGVESEIRREPFGVVLIVGPANYPLFLPGVQTLQALVAGNAVLWKPGREAGAAARGLLALLQEAGLPGGLVQVLPEDPAHVYEALAAGVELVLFTGSTEAGRKVLSAAAERVVPVIAELSGDDPVLLRADAEIGLVQQAVRFGAELNGGATCIAPRRLIGPPALLEHPSLMALGLPRRATASDAESVETAACTEQALGASIFSRDEAAAVRLAGKVRAGVVVVNDCVLPTADPRIPFGGRGASGYGVTRGAEGLLALTQVKVICRQRGRRRHLEPAQAGDAAFFLAYLRAAHSQGWRERWRQTLQLFRLAAARSRKP